LALVCGVLALGACERQGESTPARAAGRVRVLSWNVSSDAFMRDPAAFHALLRKAQADILLFDEVAPSANESQLRASLEGIDPDAEDEWHIDIGRSGGRQRGVVVSRWPLERLPEFGEVVPYPETERIRLYERMAAANDVRPGFSMDEGIPVNGAVVLTAQRRLLVVTMDLQCCGDDPGGWQEDRRRVEAREIRRLIRQILERTNVDGILIVGDLNLVNTPLPLVYVSGPYAAPHGGLIAAELYHLDGSDTWTWDGRGTLFPSAVMDVQLYSPHALELGEGYVLDSADLLPAEREELGLEPEGAHGLSAHRPLVAEYVWR
jgi:hypothetical protein